MPTPSPRRPFSGRCSVRAEPVRNASGRRGSPGDHRCRRALAGGSVSTATSTHPDCPVSLTAEGEPHARMQRSTDPPMRAPYPRGRRTKRGSHMRGAHAIGIVGMGPRGLSVLERICANERKSPSCGAVTVHVVDPSTGRRAGSGAPTSRGIC